MKNVVLVADDSQIIQKVIKIALAAEQFDISESLDEASLLDRNAQVKPSLILLDFNLSSAKTGYELAKILRKDNPSVKILMMYATFDPIDENALKDAHVTAHITKPFDGNKLIQLCRNLSETEISIPQKIIEKIENKPAIQEKVESKPKIQETSQPTQEIFSSTENSDWEIGVPGVIGASSNEVQFDLPPVIANPVDAHAVNEISLEVQSVEIEPVKADYSIPSQDDLEYPDMNTNSSSGLDLDLKPSSNLISLDDLMKAESSSTSSTQDLVLDSPASVGTMTKEEVKNIEDQINDEKMDDLWLADEFETVESMSKDVIQDVLDIGTVSAEEDFKPMDLSKLQTYQDEDLPAIQPHKLEAIQGGFTEQKEERHEDFIFPQEKQVQLQTASIHMDENELAEKILARLLPQVEKMVKDYCRSTVEKVAWEAIPEIAENLIKKEIQKISDSIIK